ARADGGELDAVPGVVAEVVLADLQHAPLDRRGVVGDRGRHRACAEGRETHLLLARVPRGERSERIAVERLRSDDLGPRQRLEPGRAGATGPFEQHRRARAWAGTRGGL